MLSAVSNIEFQHPTDKLLDDDPLAPWMIDPKFGGMSPSARRKSWAAEQRQKTPIAGDTAKSSNQTVPSKNFALTWLSDICVNDDPAFLVDGILPAGPSFGVTFGPPKSLKTFFLMHMAFHIALAQPCFGRDVLGGVVIYVTSEGISGVKRRFAALRKYYGVEGQLVPLGLISVMPNLGAGPDDREVLKKEIQAAVRGINMPVRMIVIDTLRRAIPGKSENDQKDMSIFVDNCEDLARTFGCHCNAVHHSPRSDDKRSSGSNSIDGAADVMISVVKADGIATAEVVVFKDGPEGASVEFSLSMLEVGTDSKGNALLGGYVNVLKEPSNCEGQRKPTGGHVSLSAQQQRMFDIIRKALDEAGTAQPGDLAVPPQCKAISREMAKHYAKTEGWWNEATSDKSANSNFNNKLNELAGKHAIMLSAKSIWRA